MLREYTALSFDCYGTLIDWETGMVNGLAPLVDKVRQSLSRNDILEAHARQESHNQRQTPAKKYSDLLATVYRRLAEEWGVDVTWDDCVTYGKSVADWPAFPDSADALAYLKQHYRLVILSNVDNASFAASNARLGINFDAVYTAEDVGAYKPADANFDYMIEMLKGRGIEKKQILHVAESMFHDHVPARRHSLANCWIYRRHDQQGFGATANPGAIPEVDFRFNSMAEFAEAHAKKLF